MRLKEMQVTIVGLGLMGGSLALALRGKVARISGVDRDATIAIRAVRGGIVQAATTSLAEGLAGADLLLLATPVRAIIELLAALPHLRPHDGCMVLDVGSTKREICAAMSQLPTRFAAMGGHPMCGKESAGLAEADAQLFQGQTFVLSPPTSEPDPTLLPLAIELVHAIGAAPVVISPEHHDALAALTSHLPFLLAATLMKQAAQSASEDPLIWPVSSSGLQSMTRLAGSNPQMMADILATNREPILTALHAFQSELEALILLLSKQDAGANFAWLSERRREYLRYREEKG